MRLRVAVFGTLGAAATVAGAVLVLAPDLLLGLPAVRPVVDALASAGPQAIMAAATAVVALYVLAAARSSGPASELDGDSPPERRFEAAATSPPEAVTADRRTTTGAALDEDVQAAATYGGQALRDLRALLRDLAATAYGDELSGSRRAIERGAWTDDPAASAFLAGPEGPTASLLSRVRLWLAPERERRRRIEATVEQIERLQEEP